MFTIITTYHPDGTKSALLVHSSDTTDLPLHKAADIAVPSSEAKDDATESAEAYSPMVDA